MRPVRWPRHPTAYKALRCTHNTYDLPAEISKLKERCSVPLVQLSVSQGRNKSRFCNIPLFQRFLEKYYYSLFFFLSSLRTVLAFLPYVMHERLFRPVKETLLRPSMCPTGPHWDPAAAQCDRDLRGRSSFVVEANNVHRLGSHEC